MFKLKDKAGLSLGKSKEVCGYKISKMPLGAYLRTLERLQSVPEDFMAKCFPGQSPGEILDDLIKLDKNRLAALAAGVFTAAPAYAVELVAELTDIDAEALINDENIGLDGFLAIIGAFIEVNGLGELPSAVRGILAKLNVLTTPSSNTGSSA